MAVFLFLIWWCFFFSINTIPHTNTSIYRAAGENAVTFVRTGVLATLSRLLDRSINDVGHFFLFSSVTLGGHPLCPHAIRANKNIVWQVELSRALGKEATDWQWQRMNLVIIKQFSIFFGVQLSVQASALSVTLLPRQRIPLIIVFPSLRLTRVVVVKTVGVLGPF